MKRQKSIANIARKKYSRSTYVEHGGIGTRQLTEQEISQMQTYVDEVRSGVARPCRPFRLRGDANGR